VAVAGAGRTDAGVHALAQVASFTLNRSIEPATLVRAMNARLPPAVRVMAAEESPESFHARFAARTKSYRYDIWNAEVMPPFRRNFAWHLVGPLDVEAMARAAEFVRGEHDFAVFQMGASDASTTVRRIFRSEIECEPQDANCGIDDLQFAARNPQSSIHIPQSTVRAPHSTLIAYQVTGDGFLRHMVRAIVGSLIEVGRRRRPPEWIGDLLARGHRAEAGATAPPHGLFLVSVGYTAGETA
jgi:tRNA pseudouridine38-40 synthase